MRARLDAARPQLERAGAIVIRRRIGPRRIWALRYREWVHGRRVQRAIYLGDDDVADRARTLIAQWRQERISPEERGRREVIAATEAHGKLAGLSGRARQRLRKFVREAMDDPLARCALTLGFIPVYDPLIRDGKRPGRRPSSGLT